MVKSLSLSGDGEIVLIAVQILVCVDMARAGLSRYPDLPNCCLSVRENFQKGFNSQHVHVEMKGSLAYQARTRL
jgi:hypothetical protein